MFPKNSPGLVVGLIVAVALIVIGVVMYYRAPQSPSANPVRPGPAVACTMEAKLCPDGSYVGRGGPNCEFSACPNP